MSESYSNLQVSTWCPHTHHHRFWPHLLFFSLFLLCLCHTALLADSWTCQECFLHWEYYFLLSHSVQDSSDVICQRFLALCINSNISFSYVNLTLTSGPFCLSCPVLFFSITQHYIKYSDILNNYVLICPLSVFPQKHVRSLHTDLHCFVLDKCLVINEH